MDWSEAFPFAVGDALVLTAKMGPFVRLSASAEVLALTPKLSLRYDFPAQSVLTRKLKASAGEMSLDAEARQLELRIEEREPTELPLELSRQDGTMTLSLGDPEAPVRVTLSPQGPGEAKLQLVAGVPLPLRGLSVRVLRSAAAGAR